MYYFILFLILDVVLHGCKPTRECQVNLLTADCSHRGLDHVPQNLTRAITELNLQYNEISTLRNNVFQRYNNLISLFLDNNEIVIIENNAFYGLEKLKNLSMRSIDSVIIFLSFPKNGYEVIDTISRCILRLISKPFKSTSGLNTL
jgi:hypothetical protein